MSTVRHKWHPVKNHALERNKLFYAKAEVSAFANFEVGRLIKKKMIKKLAF